MAEIAESPQTTENGLIGLLGLLGLRRFVYDYKRTDQLQRLSCSLLFSPPSSFTP